MQKPFTQSDLFFTQPDGKSGETPEAMGKPNKHRNTPAKHVIRNILNYSRSLSVINTEMSGNIFLILN